MHRKHLQDPGAGERRAVYLETFGCQMNVLDSQLVRGQLEGLGFRFIDDWRRADVVLYNTCSVREHAEQKVWSRLGELAVHKRQYPQVVVGVIGCMAERDGLDLARRYPQIDLLCGPGELDKMPMLLDNALKTTLVPRRHGRRTQAALQGNTHRRSRTLAAAEDRLELLDLSRNTSARDPAEGASAYVRITRGCNKFCTYCVVPYTRGREVHRPPRHIVEECRRLVDNGVNEITLLGQTVNHYHYVQTAAVTINGVQQPQIGAIVGRNRTTGGPQLRGGPGNGAALTTFADLLAQIHDQIPNLLRLRFVTNFARDFGDDILQTMAERPRICRYLHLPVQSGSNRLLRLMNRGYSVEEYRDLVDRVREHLPDAEIATDVICGFPTETDEDHQATANLLRDCRFKNAFIFKYSPRPGTTAHDRFHDDVPDPIKRRRNNELLAVQCEVSAEVHARYVGRTVRVLVESASPKAIKAGHTAPRSPGRPGPPSTLPPPLQANVQLGWETPGPRIPQPHPTPQVQPVLQLTGRTSSDLIVCFEGAPSLIGRVVDVRIERSAPLVLFGQWVASPVAV